ncbi:MAG: rRNA maturation RNase YbeY [Bacteroidales bacterium]|jgi:rRNA maturation RNase YbeY|nr:rRNA maturation RNase YbeY [Bacteroidales bacterium]HOA08716.1 rRNA maturation RNase YbeY [Tenuifilaceae bacterium]MBP8642689.1 rRNA maturation RNase YbeY [Bacteroidales bacterium]HOC35448.1 rRNA maturation RNase YbeY [Tenuifilaceae bacterium]HOG71219.1 rRNA maturation RNase YbeY [Tenuifilaceae bacterium]
MAISFQSNINFNLSNKRKVKTWIKNVVTKYGFKIGDVTILFTDDEYIKELNIKYLNHHYFTDILTFDYSSGLVLNGDIVISIDTVRSNSILYSTSIDDELLRVIIHGFLHLLGFNDKSSEESRKMRELEDGALNIFYSND